MSNKTDDTFFNTLKEKVDQYFADKKTDRTGNSQLYLKSSVQVLSAITLYSAIVFLNLPIGLALLFAMLFGVNLAILGFNVMHEGGHQSFSKHPWANSMAGYCLNALGGNIYFWKVKHNVNHHTFTNIAGADSDIDVQPFMRLHPNQSRQALHRYQHLYWVVLYGISYVVWIFYEDFLKYFRGKIAAHMKPMNLSMSEHIIFWATKIIYVLVFLVVPVLMLGWLKALVGFFIVTFICGLFTSVVFQLAHVVEVNTFPSGNKVDMEWAVHQLVTTSNFGTSSKILFWLLGGLNFQIEHHLFPRVSHVHYPQISRLVKSNCVEFNIPYHEYPTMLQAFISHIKHLRRMGMASQ